MTADQKRKQMTGAKIIGGMSREQYRARKKNLGTLQSDIKFSSRVHLKWDGNKKQVVAGRNQVGVSRRHLRQFVDSIPQENRYLADVIFVPQEIYELKNITEVLSYEVWKTHLSENERNQLMQFLPKDSDIEQVVQALLDGNNFHFGNPLPKWGASLCSGNLHPDAVICQERCIKSEKKAYYSELQKYHNDIIEYLVNLKERWESCNPERENLQRSWRSRFKEQRRVTSDVNQSGAHEFDGNSGTPSGSYSLRGDEEACSSDNQNSPVMKDGKIQKRIHKKGVPKDSRKDLVVGSDDGLNESKTGVKLLKRNIQCIDGAKFMSIVKVSKKQLEQLKNSKQSGESILSRSLNRDIGDLVTSQVQSYESFMEEEQKKLHEHWLRLAKDDLPAAYADWREKQLQVKQVISLLHQELKTKVNLFDEEEENYGNSHPEQKRVNTGALEEIDEPTGRLGQNQRLKVGRRSDTSSLRSHPEGDNEEDVQGPHWNRFVEVEEEKEEEGDEEEEEKEDIEERREDAENGPLQNPCVEAEGIFPGCKLDQQSLLLKYGLNSTDGLNNQFLLKPDDASPDLSVIPGNLNMQVFADKQGVPLSAGEDSWPAVTMQQSYYESTSSNGYASSRLSDVHPKVNEPQSHCINLGSNLLDGDSGKDLLQRQPGTASVSYPNEDRNDLPKTSFNGPDMIFNHNGQKRAELHFQGQNNVSIEQNHITGHYHQQKQLSMPLEQQQRRQSEAYVQRPMSESIYSEGFGFPLSRQELLPSVNLQDWAVNPSPGPAPLTGGDFLNRNWFSNEHQSRSSWIGSGGSAVLSQSLGNGTMDQSFLNVLSHCKSVQPVPSYDQMRSVEQQIPSTSYGMLSGVSPRVGNVLPQTDQSFDYMNGREAATPLIADERLWPSFPQQNPPFNNTMGKPFLKPWNH